MARLARIVIPGVAHHITQRGNRRLPVFFTDDDRRLYLDLLADAARASGTRCLAWCLIDNQVHLILVPEGADGLRTGRALAADEWIAAQETALQRALAPRRPGRKKRGEDDHAK